MNEKKEIYNVMMDESKKVFIDVLGYSKEADHLSICLKSFSDFKKAKKFAITRAMSERENLKNVYQESVEQVRSLKELTEPEIR